ncbi:MAG: phosphoglycerate dehydrogenase, partial [Candidatus Altiarchaeota archaeon]
MKLKILVTDSFPEEGIAELRNHFEVDFRPELGGEENINALASEISNYEGLIVRGMTKVTHQVVESGINLKFIARLGVSVSNIDVTAAKEKNI